MINLSTIKYSNFNERDVEVPMLLAVAQSWKGEVASILDVGACYSFFTYAKDLRKILEGVRYDGVDILPCEKTAAILDSYLQSNLADLDAEQKYDAVICISTIEHSGISSYKKLDYQKEQLGVFTKICDLALKKILLTFPFGSPGLFENEYANITKGLLQEFHSVAAAAGFSTACDFYYNEFPQGGKPWSEINIDSAAAVPLAKDKGVQCIGVFRGSRE